MTWARPRCRHVPHGPAPAAVRRGSITGECHPGPPRPQLHHPPPLTATAPPHGSLTLRLDRTNSHSRHHEPRAGREPMSATQSPPHHRPRATANRRRATPADGKPRAPPANLHHALAPPTATTHRTQRPARHLNRTNPHSRHHEPRAGREPMSATQSPPHHRPRATANRRRATPADGKPAGATREPPPRPRPADGTTPPHTATGTPPQPDKPHNRHHEPHPRRGTDGCHGAAAPSRHTCCRDRRRATPADGSRAPPRHPPRPRHTTALPRVTPPAGAGECHPPHHQRTHCCDRVNPAAEVMNPVRRAGRRPV
ncbi:hypothetical protein SCANM124S_05243 [Streptomyces canus]